MGIEKHEENSYDRRKRIFEDVLMWRRIRKLRKQWKAAGVAVIAVLWLYGCQGPYPGIESFQPETGSLFIGRDGVIASGMVEILDQGKRENYQQENLLRFVFEEVAGFNESLGAPKKAQNEEEGEVLPAAVRSCTLQDDRVTAVFQYKDSASFLAFNQNYFGVSERLNHLAVSTVLEARTQGWLSAGKMVKPGKGTELIPLEENELERLDKGQMLWIETEQPVEIQVEGAVRYMTEGVALVKKNIVQVPEGVHYLIFW